MAYQVFARKWRPQKFSQIVGQQHVTQALTNALQNQRLHHAYLFTGTRGVGKTTLARILAKAINCEQLNNATACGVCSVCTAFDAGRFLDLIEVDAASRTKVEDTRDLLDNIQYAPNQGRYKVYLIDEVHMLSGHSFNALLKTLEEPPEHVKFLLATTDPQKIPVTVLSRCLQFNLKPLLPAQISQQMELILRAEKIEFEVNALNLLARAADGSMRDGLSLLDQAIAYGHGKVQQTDVNAMLGTVAQAPIADLLVALISMDGKAIISQIAQMSDVSIDFHAVLQQILRLLHRIALVQEFPELEQHEFEPQLLTVLAEKLTAEDVQLYYQIALLGQKDLVLAPDARSGFEMLMLRMLTFKPVSLTATKTTFAAVKTAIMKPQQMAEISNILPAPLIKANIISEVSEVSEVPEVPEIPKQNETHTWEQMIEIMHLNGLTKQLANNCILDAVNATECHLLLDGNYSIFGNKVKESLQTALQNYYARPLKLLIHNRGKPLVTPAVVQHKLQQQLQQNSELSIQNNTEIQTLITKFDAQIIADSIKPLDPQSTA